MEKTACSSSSSGFSSWACLPTDIVFTIFHRLVSLPDFIRFGCVCKSWNASTLNYYKQRLIRLSNLHLPWLLVQHDSNYKCLCLYDIINAEIYKFHYTYAPYIYGFSRGWLFIMEEEKHRLTLLSPLSNTIIHLPPFDTGKFEDEEVYSVMLSSDPSLGPFEAIAISCHKFHTLAYLNSSDEFWTYLVKDNVADPPGCFKVIFHRDRIIGVSDSSGQVFSVVVTDDEDDAIHDASTKCINFLQIPTKCVTLKEIAPPCVENSDINNVETHLVETTRGDLLMILRYFVSFPTPLNKYKIYKLVLDSDHDGQLARIPIVNLGGDSLFLGFNNSISILASLYPGCSPNSIYYAGHPAIEVFHLEDESVSTILISKEYSEYSLASLPTWIKL
ncbi:hypothetical protein FNV43_RR15827 [Rhamnella rubrinervis]|uniref:F-box domain-containing protein n=1 Tax=Rhamnella rubrinervis TaxID=2594499 RepID=A0A8K0GUM2_9ROSA|nr:hypothetical protein FNV43_RR15827 [Rhamnella rubrinervis]